MWAMAIREVAQPHSENLTPGIHGNTLYSNTSAVCIRHKTEVLEIIKLSIFREWPTWKALVWCIWSTSSYHVACWLTRAIHHVYRFSNINVQQDPSCPNLFAADWSTDSTSVRPHWAVAIAGHFPPQPSGRSAASSPLARHTPLEDDLSTATSLLVASQTDV